MLDFSSFRPEPVTQPWTGSHTSPKWLLDSGTCAAESLVTRGSEIRGGAEMARSPPHSHKGGSGSLSPPLARRGSAERRAPLAASSRVRARRACAFRCTSQQPHAADGLVRTRARVTGEAASPSARAALVRRRQGPSPESALSPGVRAAGRPLGPPRCRTALRSARCPRPLGLPPWRGASRCAIGGVALKPRCRRACQSRAGHVPPPGRAEAARARSQLLRPQVSLAVDRGEQPLALPRAPQTASQP